MRETKKNRTRKKIIDAALDEFTRAGIRESSFDRIADRSEVARRTIYNHFSDKDELLQSVIDSRLEAAMEDVKALRTNDADLVAVSIFCLRFWMKDPRLILLLRRLRDEKIQVFSRLHGEFLAELRLLLEQIGGGGGLRYREPGINLELIFFSLFPVLDIISGRPDFESEFTDIFIKTLAAEKEKP